jgi:hypothetical protein
MKFARKGSLSPADAAKVGFQLPRLMMMTDSCIGGFVVEYRAISANECETIPDCLGELVHGYVIAKVEAGEHSGFHSFNVIGVYWGFGMIGVKCCWLKRNPGCWNWPVMGVGELVRK